jgi:hypothetical protein
MNNRDVTNTRKALRTSQWRKGLYDGSRRCKDVEENEYFRFVNMITGEHVPVQTYFVHPSCVTLWNAQSVSWLISTFFVFSLQVRG